jgi:hypothetical protein
MLAGPVWAQAASEAQLRALADVLRMDQTLAVMQTEAIANADEITPDLFGTPDLPAWDTAVAALFDPALARAGFDAALIGAAGNIDGADLQAAIDFFATPLGARLLDLELSARTAMIDDDVEAAAKENWQVLRDNPLPASTKRAALIRDIVAANDLIETNVAAALNGNLAFYQGMAEAGGHGAGQSGDDMIREVWDQEAQVRADTEDWLYPYLAMSYAPLSDDDLQAYIDFSNSDAGRALNQILFMSFDALGVEQSRGMGLAAGRLMAGQDI